MAKLKNGMDDPAGELNLIITNAAKFSVYGDNTVAVDKVALMTELVRFVQRRDHKIFEHAYRLGKEDFGNNESKSN